MLKNLASQNESIHTRSADMPRWSLTRSGKMKPLSYMYKNVLAVEHWENECNDDLVTIKWSELLNAILHAKYWGENKLGKN